MAKIYTDDELREIKFADLFHQKDIYKPKLSFFRKIFYTLMHIGIISIMPLIALLQAVVGGYHGLKLSFCQIKDIWS